MRVEEENKRQMKTVCMAAMQTVYEKVNNLDDSI